MFIELSDECKSTLEARQGTLFRKAVVTTTTCAIVAQASSPASSGTVSVPAQIEPQKSGRDAADTRSRDGRAIFTLATIALDREFSCLDIEPMPLNTKLARSIA